MPDIQCLPSHVADLIAAGVAPGPRIGALLRRALDATVDGLVPNKRDDLLAYLDV